MLFESNKSNKPMDYTSPDMRYSSVLLSGSVLGDLSVRYFAIINNEVYEVDKVTYDFEWAGDND